MAATACIAGAGIGGLAAAVALARAGWQVRLVERHAAIAEIGAGIQLTPNATRALAQLGLLERIAAVASTPDALVVRNGRRGEVLVRAPLGAHAERLFGSPWLVVHRGDLVAQLAAAVAEMPAIEVSLSTALTNHRATAEGIVATLTEAAGPREVEADVLIGADGLWSAARHLAGDVAAPTPCGFLAWRATVAMDRLPGALAGRDIVLWLGPNGHLVQYPLRGGAVCNLVAVMRDEAAAARPRDDWNAPGTPAVLRARFARWVEPVQALVALSENWATFVLADRPPLPRWSRGRATLIGDAAHPTLPFLAQGAAMALEDACVLGGLLRPAADVATGLASYEAMRAPRTARLQRAARRTGALYHLDGLAAAGRDLALRLGGPAALLARHRWIYAWTGA